MNKVVKKQQQKQHCSTARIMTRQLKLKQMAYHILLSVMNASIWLFIWCSHNQQYQVSTEQTGFILV